MVSRVLAPHLGASTSCRIRELEGRVDVWLARVPPAGEAGFLQRCREFLSPREAESCAAFRREEDRQRARVARVLVRETLSRYAPVHPAEWNFAARTHGKPEITAPAGLRLCFNLSHTASLVACAVTVDNDIGLDIEATSRACDLSGIAGRVFSHEELAAFRALDPDSRRTRFFQIWTLKEAYLKARGSGFALDPRSVSFVIGEGGRAHLSFGPGTGERPTDWSFARLDRLPGHVLALAARTRGRPISMRTYVVELSEPFTFSARPRWFGREMAERARALCGIALGTAHLRRSLEGRPQ